jgi:hypothetical protein
MIIILGLVILVAALIIGVAGVMGNGGSTHAVGHFSVLGYHVTGSAGSLFLSGIVVGAAGLAGLSLLLAGAQRTSRRGSAARRGFRQSRRETAATSQERDALLEQRDTARAITGSVEANGAEPPAAPLSPAGDRWSWLRDLGHRLAPAHAAAQSASSTASASSPDAGPTGISPPSDVAAGPSQPDVVAAAPAVDAHASASAPAE